MAKGKMETIAKGMHSCQQENCVEKTFKVQMNMASFYSMNEAGKRGEKMECGTYYRY